MQIEKIDYFNEEPDRADIELKILEIIKKTNLLIEDYNYIDENSI